MIKIFNLTHRFLGNYKLHDRNIAFNQIIFNRFFHVYCLFCKYKCNLNEMYAKCNIVNSR